MSKPPGPPFGFSNAPENAPSTLKGTIQAWKALGYTKEARRWLVKHGRRPPTGPGGTPEKPAFSLAPESPPGVTGLSLDDTPIAFWRPSPPKILDARPLWPLDVEPFVPGEFLSVFDAVMLWHGRTVEAPELEYSDEIDEIGHWIGKPYKHELPDPMSVSTKDFLPGRIRRSSWALTQEILAAIAAGTIPIVTEQQIGNSRYGQVMRTADFLRWAKVRGGYGSEIGNLLAEHENEPHEPVKPEPLAGIESKEAAPLPVGAPGQPSKRRPGPISTAPKIQTAAVKLSTRKIEPADVGWKKFTEEILKECKVKPGTRGYSLDTIRIALRPTPQEPGINEEGEST
jgi:hypothetical protein